MSPLILPVLPKLERSHELEGNLLEVGQNVQLVDTVKVEAIDREGDGEWELLGLIEERPEEQPPILAALFAPNAQPVDGAEESQNLLQLEVDRRLPRLVFA